MLQSPKMLWKVNPHIFLNDDSNYDLKIGMWNPLSSLKSWQTWFSIWCPCRVFESILGARNFWSNDQLWLPTKGNISSLIHVQNCAYMNLEPLFPSLTHVAHPTILPQRAASTAWTRCCIHGRHGNGGKQYGIFWIQEKLATILNYFNDPCMTRPRGSPNSTMKPITQKHFSVGWRQFHCPSASSLVGDLFLQLVFDFEMK